MNREKYIESYTLRNGSSKNASKSYTRYLEGVIKQDNQAKRKDTRIARYLEEERKRNSK
tara:strand:- start:504 stop:680 length:177 start_codon:yes stop_codon:yes gene_type:complete